MSQLSFWIVGIIGMANIVSIVTKVSIVCNFGIVSKVIVVRNFGIVSIVSKVSIVIIVSIGGIVSMVRIKQLVIKGNISLYFQQGYHIQHNHHSLYN